VDPKEVARRLERIRNTVQQQLATGEDASLGSDLPPEAPPSLRPGVGLLLSGEPNLSSTPDLEEANELARLSARPIPPSRVPLVGPLLTLVRRLANPFVKVFAGHHIAHQEAFNAHVVRHLNDLGVRLERRVRELEEALIVWSANPGGLDDRVRAALGDYDAALRQRHMVLFSALGEELTTLQNLTRDAASSYSADLVELSQKLDRRFDEKDDAADAAMQSLQDHLEKEMASSLDRLESTAAELLSMRAVLRETLENLEQREMAAPAVKTPAAAAKQATPSPADRATGAAAGRAGIANAGKEPAPGFAWEGLETWIDDQDYRSFQASFRGDADEIAERMRVHVERFQGVEGVIADLGCGRGEFLDLLSAAGHSVVGVEINTADVEECRKRGHEAVVSDLFVWLREQSTASLGGIFLAQVIEHLAPPQWQQLVDLAATRLAPGGRLVVETINPESLYALVRAYVADPTHIRPVHPGLLEFLARRAGFHPVEVELQAAVPDDERPTNLPIEAFDDEPSLQRLARSVQDLFDRVDRLCCAPQEYTLSATKPGGSSGGES
jgi:SAM-dependent methyltransferase